MVFSGRVSPYDFWRTIFPEGFLQPRGEEVPWHERGGGHPNGIAIQITNRTKTVKTKTGRKRDVPVVERFTLTDDLDGVMERVVESNRKNESTSPAPCGALRNPSDCCAGFALADPSSRGGAQHLGSSRRRSLCAKRENADRASCRRRFLDFPNHGFGHT